MPTSVGRPKSMPGRTDARSSYSSPMPRPCGRNRCRTNGAPRERAIDSAPGSGRATSRLSAVPTSRPKSSRAEHPACRPSPGFPRTTELGALAQHAREQQAHLIFIPNKLEWIDELSSQLGSATTGEELEVPGIEVREVGSEPSAAGPGG